MVRLEEGVAVRYTELPLAWRDPAIGESALITPRPNQSEVRDGTHRASASPHLVEILDVTGLVRNGSVGVPVPRQFIIVYSKSVEYPLNKWYLRFGDILRPRQRIPSLIQVASLISFS